MSTAHHDPDSGVKVESGLQAPANFDRSLHSPVLALHSIATADKGGAAPRVVVQGGQRRRTTVLRGRKALAYASRLRVNLNVFRSTPSNRAAPKIAFFSYDDTGGLNDALGRRVLVLARPGGTTPGCTLSGLTICDDPCQYNLSDCDHKATC